LKPLAVSRADAAVSVRVPEYGAGSG
jgi:hypothetical protein